MKQSKFFRHWA